MGNEPNEDQKAFSHAIHEFQRVLKNLGIDLPPSMMTQPMFNRSMIPNIKDPIIIEKTLRQSLRGLLKAGITSLLVTLLIKSILVYESITQLCDREFGMHTVCVIGDRKKFFSSKPKEVLHQRSLED